MVILKYKSLLFFLLFPMIHLGCVGEKSSERHAFQSSEELVSTWEAISIMSFNIRYDNPNDGINRWEHRKDHVASIIHNNADIVGTQEGMINQLKDLDSMLITSSYQFDRVGISRDGSEDEGEFCAIYYRSGRFDLIDTGTFWLSETPGYSASIGWDAALPRITTWVKLQDISTKYSFYVFNTHFDHRGVAARENSSKLLLEKIAEIAYNQPVIILGDLNATEDQEPYKILTGQNQESSQRQFFDGFYHSEAGHMGPSTTWNGFDRIIPDRRIDFILANESVKFIHHRILTDERDGRFPSDHLPVVAEIEFLNSSKIN